MVKDTKTNDDTFIIKESKTNDKTFVVKDIQLVNEDDFEDNKIELLGTVENIKTRLVEINIRDLSASELYSYEKLCEFIIDKLINEIKMENQNFSTMYMQDSITYANYVGTEKEKEFTIYKNIHDKIIKEIKRRLLLMTWD